MQNISNLDQWLSQAKKIVSDANVICDAFSMEKYSRDEFPTNEFSKMPKAVVFPENEADVASLVKLCYNMGIPVTARGGGTGLCGACNPSENGVVLSLEKLNKLIEADEKNHTITVQAGMLLHDLYNEVKKIGLFFPPHPGDDSAFAGGVVATNAGGSRAVKYGTVKKFVLGLQVVCADGQIIELGGKFIKNSSGYNLLDLMVGSEGTLGIITRVTFLLIPKPGFSQTFIIPFSSIKDAIDMVPIILRANIVPTAIEFVEHSAIKLAENVLKRKWPAQTGEASLMIIIDGRSQKEVMEIADDLANCVEKNGGDDVLVAGSKSKQAQIMEMRSTLFEILKPGDIELFDTCVPRSEIANHVEFIHELEKLHEIPIPAYGHAGDGNVHSHTMKFEIKDGYLGKEIENWKQKNEKVRKELLNDAVKRGGVISGEHGIGLVKRDFLANSINPKNIEMMKAIKKALDPKGILNPGKIIN